MRQDGGSVFPAHANTGDPTGPGRGLSANEIARALISMMVGSHNELQSETGYIDARPHIRQIEETSCNARPDHTLGSNPDRGGRGRRATSFRSVPETGRKFRASVRRSETTRSANTGLMHCSKRRA